MAIVGSGVVGTATGKGLLAMGYEVAFCDVAPARVASLRKQGFRAIHAADLAQLQAAAYLISVPTPTVRGRADLQAIEAAAEEVGRALVGCAGWPLVVVRSTVPPGTTDSVVLPILQSVSGRIAGREFGMCMNPEFLREATAEEDFLHPPVIVIGALDERSDLALRGIYGPWADVPVVSTSLLTAEATKYVANLFNATKVSYFNEMFRVLTEIGADASAAFEGAVRGGPGFRYQWYGTRCGAPFGGACLPKDTEAFFGFAEDIGSGDLMPILQATIRVNREMAEASAPPDSIRPKTRPIGPGDLKVAQGS